MIKYTLKSLATLVDLGCFIWALDAVATLCNEPYSPVVIGGLIMGLLFAVIAGGCIYLIWYAEITQFTR